MALESLFENGSLQGNCISNKVIARSLDKGSPASSGKEGDTLAFSRMKWAVGVGGGQATHIYQNLQNSEP